MAEPELFKQGGNWLSVPYAIYCGPGAGNDGNDAALGHGASGNQATFVIQVGWENVTQAIQELCGTYFFSPSNVAPGYLSRVIPKQHPMWHFLYVSRITSVKPMQLIGKDLDPDGPGTYPEYTHATLSILFQMPKYPVIGDTALDQAFPFEDCDGPVRLRREYRRYIEWCSQVGTEYITIERSSLRYAEGNGLNGKPYGGIAYAGPPSTATAITTPWARPTPKGSIVANWRLVPMCGLLSQTTERPLQLEAALGKVNKYVFRGYPIGTLRLDSYRYTINEAPYHPSVFLGNMAGAFVGPNMFIPSCTADVELVFSYFDPPHSKSAYRGHNLMPYRRTLDGTEGAVDPDDSWFLASVNGDPDGARLVPAYDFRLMFQKSIDPPGA